MYFVDATKWSYNTEGTLGDGKNIQMVKTIYKSDNYNDMGIIITHT